jgi:hypothetical protein
LAQIQASSFYTGRQIPKATDEGRCPGILRIPGLVIRRPYMVTHGEGRKDAPNVSAEDGTENTACCLELQREDAGRRKRTIVKNIVAASGSLKWKWRSHVT